MKRFWSYGKGRDHIVIKPITIGNPILSVDEEEVCMAAWAEDPEARVRNLAMNKVSVDTTAKPDLWHRRLGHPSTTVSRRMLPLFTGHNLITSDALKTRDCIACIKSKFIKHPSLWQLPTELPPPLHRFHGDICGPINPPSCVF